jgi:hypothetical protein
VDDSHRQKMERYKDMFDTMLEDPSRPPAASGAETGALSGTLDFGSLPL